MGGRIQGAAVEADRQTRIVIEGAGSGEQALLEAARLGIEFGKWTQPLDHRQDSAGLKAWCLANGVAYLPALTFGDWECAYCGAPLWTDPDGAYARGDCLQCIDWGVAPAERKSYFATRTLPAFSDWLNEVDRIKSDGGRWKCAVPGWPRPEEYDENASYVVDPWPDDPGVPRWVAVHLALGAWNGTAFADGESIAAAETRLGRTVGPVQLKAILTADYEGTGQVLRVAATRPDDVSEWRSFTVPEGAVTGDIVPLKWRPHWRYPLGYYKDVTDIEVVSGDGTVHCAIVNDGPAWHGAGIVVKHAEQTPWACDVKPVGYRPWLTTDWCGRTWLAAAIQGTVHVWSASDPEGVWRERPVVAEGEWSFPSIARKGDGSVRVSACDGDGVMHLWVSWDDGATWEEIEMGLGSGLVNGSIVGQMGMLFAVGLAGGNVVAERSMDGGVSSATWIAGGTQRTICAAADDAIYPVAVARSTGELVAVVQTEEGLAFYTSPTRGESWELVT
jgi:hypothetical protein